MVNAVQYGLPIKAINHLPHSAVRHLHIENLVIASIQYQPEHRISFDWYHATHRIGLTNCPLCHTVRSPIVQEGPILG